MKLITRQHLITGLVLAGMAFSTLAHAASYKWTDAQGNVHYSQHPPRGKTYTKMKKPATPRSSSPAAKPAAPATSGSAPATSSKSGEAALKKEQANLEEARKTNCANAKKNLRAYTLYRRIRGTDGKIVVLTDEVRNKHKKRAADAVKEYCS